MVRGHRKIVVFFLVLGVICAFLYIKTPIIQYEVDISQNTIMFYAIGNHRITSIDIKLENQVLEPILDKKFHYQIVNSGREHMVVEYQKPNGSRGEHVFDIDVASDSWIIMVTQYAGGQQISYNWF